MDNVIGTGKESIVYDIGNNRVLKTTRDKAEYNAALEFIGEELEYTANFISANIDENDMEYPYYLIKEKIKQSNTIVNIIEELEQKWDAYAFSGFDLIGYLKGFLINDKANIDSNINIRKFLHVLDNKEREIFKQWIDIIKFLKEINITNIDMHSENFGIKNNHLALFELGHATIG